MLTIEPGQGVLVADYCLVAQILAVLDKLDSTPLVGQTPTPLLLCSTDCIALL